MLRTARARQPHGIDAEMRAEAAVLDGDEGVVDMIGQFADLHLLALGQSAARDRAALDVDQRDHLRWRVGEKVRGVGKLRNQVREQDSAGEQHPHRPR